MSEPTSRHAVVSYRVSASIADKRNTLLEGIQDCAAEFVELGTPTERIIAELADKWIRDTLVVSSVHQQMKHPAIEQIIAMGPQALPFIKQRIEAKEGMWFAPLFEITGIDAAQGEDTVEGAETKWLAWLNENVVQEGESNG